MIFKSEKATVVDTFTPFSVVVTFTSREDYENLMGCEDYDRSQVDLWDALRKAYLKFNKEK
jgi:hypothetical protein